MIYFGIYLLLSVIATFLISKGNIKEWLLKLAIVTFLPIIGWFIPTVWPNKWLKKDEHFFGNYLDAQVEDLQLERLNSISKIEKENELNIISIEEALLVNNVSVRRKVLIDILKEDALQYIDVLKTAVVNEDTETSHYAVTAVIEVKRKLTLLMQKLEVQYSQNRNNSTLAQTYANIIKEYLNSGFLDGQSTKKYQSQFIQIMEQIINNEDATEKTFIDKIHMELAFQDTIAAEQTVILFKQHYPLNEQAYILAMKIYFETFAVENLRQEIEALKVAPITLSYEALNYVRYWSGVFNANERVIKK